MVTEEDLQEQYSKMETADLLGITANKSGYTDLAISVAMKELKSRKVPEKEIRERGDVIYKQANKYWIENCLFDLSFSQKVVYYFILWIPRTRKYYSDNFRQNGYFLKLNQSNYYSFLGFIFFIGTFICGFTFNSLFLLFSTWPAGFLLSYLYDVNFNKLRQTTNLQKMKDDGELSTEYS
ncbi:MAG: hypothetical protein ABI203_01955 [Mucilaginibacter sp.]